MNDLVHFSMFAIISNTCQLVLKRLITQKGNSKQMLVDETSYHFQMCQKKFLMC